MPHQIANGGGGQRAVIESEGTAAGGCRSPSRQPPCGRPSTRRPAGGCCIASAARAPNTSPSSSELLARRFAPWTPVQAISPAANSPGNGRAAPLVGVDAAHHVVRGRADRNRIASRDRAPPDDTSRRQSETARDMRARSRCASVRNTGPPVCSDSRTMLRATTSRGRQIAVRVIPHHERLAPRVDEPAPPRRAALRRGESAAHQGNLSAVGWNCTNSRSATRAPA